MTSFPSSRVTTHYARSLIQRASQPSPRSSPNTPSDTLSAFLDTVALWRQQQPKYLLFNIRCATWRPTRYWGRRVAKLRPQESVRQRIADGSLSLFVVKDAIAHAKIYLMESDHGSTRALIGSANLSEQAFSGRQAETFIVYVDDTLTWSECVRQYESVRNEASSRLDLPKPDAPLERRKVRIEETPALFEAQEDPKGTTLYLPPADVAEKEFSIPEVRRRVEVVAPVYRQALAGLSPNRRGELHIARHTVKEMIHVVSARPADDEPSLYLSRKGSEFVFCDEPMRLDSDPQRVSQDVAYWIEFFANYGNGFIGDVPKLQRDYFAFMCWFYLSPLLCDLRNAALRQKAFSYNHPMFAVLFGSSNCGKSSLVDTLMLSMFSVPRIVESQQFTPAKLRILQQNFKRFPVVFDDITKARFARHGEEVIKDESIPYAEYPCFALSMNADAHSFKEEIIKRCLLIYTRTQLPGDRTVERAALQQSVATIQKGLSTHLYHEYLKRILPIVDANTESSASPGEEGGEAPDILRLSSDTLCSLFREHLPEGASMPSWCAPLSLASYQSRAYERPRMVLDNLLGHTRHHTGAAPPDGYWTLDGNKIVISVSTFGFSRMREDIPDWLIDDTASGAGRITLDKKRTEDFLGRAVRKRRRWGWTRG